MDTLSRLRQVPLFATLTDADLALIEPLVKRERYDAGTTLCQQGDVGNALYIVDSGELAVLNVDARGIERTVDTLQPGQFAGEMALLLGEPSKIAITVKTAAELLVIRREEFIRLLQERNDLRAHLLAGVKPQVRKRFAEWQFPWLMPNEVTMLVTRKHWWALVQALPKPVALTLPLLILAISSVAFVPGTALSALAWAVTFLVAIVSFAYTIVDWRNDLYVITNRHVVHLERALLLRTERHEAPIEKIQNVEAVQPTFFHRIIGVCDVVIATPAVRGAIVFAKIPNADMVRDMVFEQIQRTRAQQMYEEREQLKRELHAKIRGVELQPAAAVVPAPPQPARLPRRSLKQVIGERFARRIERDGTITWRKHWIALGGQVWRPVAIFLLLIFMVIVLYWIGILQSFPLLSPILGVLLFAMLGWAIWEWIDWGNDIYVVTANRVVDLERNPLGIIQRSVQAPLIAITNVSYQQPNWWSVALNVGNVVIETAGATGQMVFLSMFQPGQVANEILQHVENVREQPWQAQREERHAAFLDWLAAFHGVLEDEGVAPSSGAPPAPPGEGGSSPKPSSE